MIDGSAAVPAAKYLEHEIDLKLTCLACGQGNRIPEVRLAAGPKCGKCGASLMSDGPIEISLDVLKTAVRLDDLPLIVDFWAPWCGPCRMMAPEFAQASKIMKGRARFAKLNTEIYPQAGARYDIRGIPLLIAFRAGREVKRQAGAMASTQIVQWAAGLDNG